MGVPHGKLFRTGSVLDIFVYGTLKPGENSYKLCASSVVAVRPAIAFGRLYTLPFGYPVMTPGAIAMGANIVQGVILSFADARILAVLDAYEQHDPDAFHHHAPNLSIAHHQYDRTQIKVYDQAQRFLGFAWSYVMSPEQVQRLHGVWLPDGRWHQPQP